MSGKEESAPEIYDPDNPPDLSQGDWPEKFAKVPVRYGPPSIEELMSGRERATSRNLDSDDVPNPSKDEGTGKITRVLVRRGRPS